MRASAILLISIFCCVLLRSGSARYHPLEQDALIPYRSVREIASETHDIAEQRISSTLGFPIDALEPILRSLVGSVGNSRAKRSTALISELLWPLWDRLQSVYPLIIGTLNFDVTYLSSLVEQGLHTLWYFLSTTALPWLYQVSLKAKKLPALPPFVLAMIQAYLAFYNILWLMGYVP